MTIAVDLGRKATTNKQTFIDLMAPVFNQALKAGYVGFVTDTYTMYKQQSIKSYKRSCRG